MRLGRSEIRGFGLSMVDIPKLVDHWRQGALEDWEVASDLVGRGRYRHGLFFAHLAIEKAVKAYVSLRTQDVPPKIHNLVRLCELAGLEPRIEHAGILADMNAFSLAGRYPDSLPAPVGQDEAQRLLAQAHEVLQWLIAP